MKHTLGDIFRPEPIRKIEIASIENHLCRKVSLSGCFH